MKILCVDDDEDIALLLDSVLSANEHKVTICNNGVDALSLIEKENFNLILLDLQMPGLTGKDVINSLEKDRLIELNNIVILSAENLEESETLEFTQKGIKEILQKPIRLEKLLETVKNFE
ncbi:MAG: response regulator [Nitrosopumilus sp.]|nr:response regulator [Nitrosopumilus sp.]MDH3385487.1 response regulator [Nitrosopumilus sp.]